MTNTVDDDSNILDADVDMDALIQDVKQRTGFTPGAALVMVSDREILNALDGIGRALSDDAGLRDNLVQAAEARVPWAMQLADVDKLADLINSLVKMTKAKQE